MQANEITARLETLEEGAKGMDRSKPGFGAAFIVLCVSAALCRQAIERGDMTDAESKLMGAEAAWSRYANLKNLQTLVPLAVVGKAYSDRQAEAALARWADRSSVNDLIEALAGAKDALGDWIPASELWESLWSELDGYDLNPQEEGNGIQKRYDYTGGSITYEAFRKHLSRTRKEWSKTASASD